VQKFQQPVREKLLRSPQPLRRSRTRGKVPENAAGRFTVSFSRAAAAMLCLVLVMAVVWAFFMGFMVGRQNPAQRVEQMTALLRDGGPARPAASGSAQDGRSGGPPAASGEDADRESGGSVSSASSAAPVTQKPGALRAFDPLNPPEGGALDAWGIRDTPAGAVSGQSGAKAAEKLLPPTEEEPQFNWVFQMAAFRDKADAARLQTRLEKAGYRVSLTGSGRVTLVMVRLRGGKAEAERLRGQAREYRLGEPLLQSRQPVSARKAKR
jgi:cell division septation protein DedD